MLVLLVVVPFVAIRLVVVRLVKTAESARRSVEKYPVVEVAFVIVELLAVISPPTKLELVIFVADKLVDVELVIVALVAVREVGLSVPIERLVMVAEVIVALVPLIFVELVVTKLEVEALVVEAKRVVS